uniref:Ionotropic receptor n=1 Tax=Stomoxys calcitrans TaxID=35570 RepID=A0A1I8PX91_STOCA
MKLSQSTVLYVILTAVWWGKGSLGIDAILPAQQSDVNLIYKNLLKEIYKEQAYETMLLVHREYGEDLAAFHEFAMPKVLLTLNGSFYFKHFFNSEVLVVVKMSSKLDMALLETTANTLNYTRQSRMLIMAENVLNQKVFFTKLLGFLQMQKMTNVLLVLSYQDQWLYFKLQPYPEYHWQNVSTTADGFFTKHWHNLQNKTLMTFVEQTASRTLVYVDSQGQLQMSGFVAKLVLLFAEHYNATLSMFYPLQVGNKTHFSVINQMVLDELLDIPITLVPLINVYFRCITDTYEINQIRLLIPLGKVLTAREIFGVLLNGYFFGCLLLATLLFSTLHSMVVYLRYGLYHHLDFIVNDKIFPGILGQSFPTLKLKTTSSLKILYFFVGFIGLNVATLYSAKTKTLFTSPPTLKNIRTFEDLEHSSLKFLLPSDDAREMGINDILAPVKNSLLISSNTSFVHENRQNLNPAFVYGATTQTYNILWRKQMFSSRPTFHSPPETVLYGMIPWGFQLQHNSPYLEPLNQLIHQVHAVGLMHVWHDQLFLDMLRLKLVSIEDLNPVKEFSQLSMEDLFFIWLILVIGWGSSALVWLMEMWIYRMWIVVE